MKHQHSGFLHIFRQSDPEVRECKSIETCEDDIDVFVYDVEDTIITDQYLEQDEQVLQTIQKWTQVLTFVNVTTNTTYSANVKRVILNYKIIKKLYNSNIFIL